MTWDMGQGEGFTAITVLGKCESFCENSGAQNYRHFFKKNMHFRFALDFRLHKSKRMKYNTLIILMMGLVMQNHLVEGHLVEQTYSNLEILFIYTLFGSTDS